MLRPWSGPGGATTLGPRAGEVGVCSLLSHLRLEGGESGRGPPPPACLGVFPSPQTEPALPPPVVWSGCSQGTCFCRKSKCPLCSKAWARPSAGDQPQGTRSQTPKHCSSPATCRLSVTPSLAQPGSCQAARGSLPLPLTWAIHRATLMLEHVGGSVLASRKSGRSWGNLCFMAGEADISPGSPGARDRNQPQLV